MPAGKTAQTPNHNPVAMTADQIQEEIRTRAYQLHLERGQQDEDWVRAEIEILARHGIERTA
jgi:hypothetical protein